MKNYLQAKYASRITNDESDWLDEWLEAIPQGMAKVCIYFVSVMIGVALLIRFAPEIKAVSIAIFGG